MDKYYTPDLKEFHPGFEYETITKWHIVKDGNKITFKHDLDEWSKKIYIPLSPNAVRPKGKGIEFVTLEDEIKAGIYRVKSFDAQDLSDLEWEVSLKGAFNFRAEKELPFDRKATVWIKEDGKIQIDLKSPNESRHRKEAAYFVETIFLGHIRNKSEFKRITEQLVI